MPVLLFVDVRPSYRRPQDDATATSSKALCRKNADVYDDDDDDDGVKYYVA